MWVPADPASLGLVQRSVEKGPEAGAAKLTPMIIDRLPRREIARQVAPRTAGTQQIKEGIEDGAEASGGGVFHAVIWRGKNRWRQSHSVSERLLG